MTQVTRSYDDAEWKLVPKEPAQEMIDNTAFFGGIDEARITYIAMLAAAPQLPAAQSRPVGAVTDADIRKIFIAAGFTIKEGQADLKPYVYTAAHALLDRAAVQGSEDKRDAERYRYIRATTKALRDDDGNHRTQVTSEQFDDAVDGARTGSEG